MTLFAGKGKLELELLAIDFLDRDHARKVCANCDRASWDNDIGYIAIEQIKTHGTVLDIDVREHPYVRAASNRRLGPITTEQVERLCWNHCAIRIAEQFSTIIRSPNASGTRTSG